MQSEQGKTVEIHIDNITEGNRREKLAELEKCLAGHPFRAVAADGTRMLPGAVLRIRGFDRAKVEKAMRTMSFSLVVPLKAAKGEAFMYRAQEDLTDRWAAEFSRLTREAYGLVTGYFDLPEVTVMSKAEYLTYKGKVLYDCENGEPIPQKHWEHFVRTLEQFLNRKVQDAGKRITLQSASLGKILDRMLKYNTLEAVKRLQLDALKYHGRTFDWIADSVKNMARATGEPLTRTEQARIQVMAQSAGQRITKVTDVVKDDVKQILIDGVKGRKSKSQVSQDLFDCMVGHNRDFQRIADTEIQNATNSAFVREEAHNAAPGEKVYLERIEIADGNTCPFCRQMNGRVVVWSETPLANDKVSDPVSEYAIWEGKEWSGRKGEVCIGAFHPYCRGSWVRWTKAGAATDALAAQVSGNGKRWNAAVETARAEWAKKGMENPDDRTPGYIDRINELYVGGLQKSLTWSGHRLQGRRKFAGMDISIENRKGSIRSGTDRDGHEWKIKMKYAYGYIRGTVGADGDHLDCYLGDNEDAPNVYVVHQNFPETGRYDEDKCMLGFDSLEQAKRAYLSQYDRPGFLGSIDTVPTEVFRQKVFLKKYHGKRLDL